MSAHPAPRARFALLLPLSFAVSFTNNMVAFSILFYAVDRFGAGPSQAGLIAGLHSTLYFLGCLVWPLFTRKLHPRWALVAAPALMGLSLTGVLFAPELGWVFAAHGLFGVSVALFWPKLMGWLTWGVPAEKLSRLMGRFNLSWSLGGILAPWVGGLLLELQAPLPFALALGVYALGVTAVLIVTTLRPSLRAPQAPPLGSASAAVAASPGQGYELQAPPPGPASLTAPPGSAHPGAGVPPGAGAQPGAAAHPGAAAPPGAGVPPGEGAHPGAAGPKTPAAPAAPDPATPGPRTAPTEAPAPAEPTWLRYPARVGLFTSYALMGVLLNIFPLHARQTLGLTESTVGTVLLFRLGLAALGFPLWGQLRFWQFRARWLPLANLALIPLALLLGLAESPWALAPLFGLAGLVFSFQYNGSVFYGAWGSSVPERAMGIHEANLTLGLLLGTIGGGWLAEHAGFAWALGGATGVALLGALLQTALIFRFRRPG